MNLLPRSHEEFSQKDYWDTFFKKRGNRAFEWYGEYPELAGNLHKYIKINDEVLITGCGNSTLGRDLYDIGYRKITNIDISQVVIRQMISQREKDRSTLKYIQMDALNMTFENEQFHVVLDKGTLDALMPDDNIETNKNIDKYFSEVQRVLKFSGRYICISLLQEHILKKMLYYFPCNNWMFRIVRCYEAEKKAVREGENAMPVFIVVCTKFRDLPTMILEINLGSLDKMQRFSSIEEVSACITNVQQTAFICSGLKRTSIADENEVALDLHEPGTEKPRFTVHIVDIRPELKNSQYAAFMVPQGREAEWLFSTKAGRKHLVRATKHNRLAIITLHRGQKYDTFESVQNELSEIVCNLAPSSLSEKKIPFLSLGSDVGKRIIKYEGHSEYSGDYVVEDVEMENKQKFRRLYYLSSQLVIQSEAKIKTVTSRKGVVRDVIDLAHLTCKHHIYMSIGTYLACKNKQMSRVAVVGLGGGGLCSFLHSLLPKSNILGIDIDPEMLKVAIEWFGLQQGEKLSARVEDGLEFAKHAANKGEQWDAILFDVDSKDSTIGMSCPPKKFLENESLNNIVKIIGNSGLFILNLVLRDESLRPVVLKDLKSKFMMTLSYKLEEDLNEIIICGNTGIKESDIKRSLAGTCLEMNKFFKKNKISTDIEVEDFLESLKINK